MELPLSESQVPRLEWCSAASSTNDELVLHATGAEAASWPDLSVLATDNQTNGRGRLGRSWIAPAGLSLAVSVLFRPVLTSGKFFPADSLGWLPLLAGAAMTRAVSSLVDAAGQSGERRDDRKVSLKWPNDVLIGTSKVSGVLSELLPGGDAVVVGAGINVTLSEEELPVLTATSLRLAGVNAVSMDVVLSSYLRNLVVLYSSFVRHGGDARESGLSSVVTELCGTLGERVRVELPGGETVIGIAKSIDDSGQLRVERATDGSCLVVSAADIIHLGHE
jgi:BirA family biotin operon repressor/biotin-[acetyl-CoA-carboxylase] ligase